MIASRVLLDADSVARFLSVGVSLSMDGPGNICSVSISMPGIYVGILGRGSALLTRPSYYSNTSFSDSYFSFVWFKYFIVLPYYSLL